LLQTGQELLVLRACFELSDLFVLEFSDIFSELLLLRVRLDAGHWSDCARVLFDAGKVLLEQLLIGLCVEFEEREEETLN
jgi:hypothetical protein